MFAETSSPLLRSLEASLPIPLFGTALTCVRRAVSFVFACESADGSVKACSCENSFASDGVVKIEIPRPLENEAFVYIHKFGTSFWAEMWQVGLCVQG